MTKTLRWLLPVPLLGAGLWYAFSSEPAPSAPPTVATPKRILRQLMGPTSPDIPATDPAAFEVLSPPHRPDALQQALADMPAWLSSLYPEANAEYLGTDCAAPPCLVGVAWEGSGFETPERMRAFVRDYQAEVEHRAGFPMAAVYMEEDRQGRQYIWMSGLPADLPADDPLRDDLLAKAAERHHQRMAPLLPDILAAEAQSGE